MKKIKYTPDAADKLRALKSAISGEYGGDKAKKIIKSITDAIIGKIAQNKIRYIQYLFPINSRYNVLIITTDTNPYA